MRQATRVGIFALFLISSGGYADDAVQVTVAPQASQKVSLALVMVGDRTDTMNKMVMRLQEDLSFSGQCAVTTESLSAIPSAGRIKQLCIEKKYQLALFINELADGNQIAWRVYDTRQAYMVCGKKYTKRGTHPSGWAHNIADAVWPVLTNQKGFFSSKLAYCKQIDKNGKRYKHIYVTDYDGKNEQVLVANATVNVAPRWNRDQGNPLLFYSEYARSNVRLMAVDMKGAKRVTSNFDGINMLPTFSPNGKEVVYCSSRGDGSCQLYYCSHNDFKRLTHNNGNNVSPTFSNDGTQIVFCSDFQTGAPQLYSYSLATQAIKRLTAGGYCASPSYSPDCQRVAYAKIMRGTMQLFVYDYATKIHTQVTRDAGNKEECCWSPCGNYLLFSHMQGDTSRIELLDMLSKKRRTITQNEGQYSFPTWSPLYQQFPIV